MALARLFRCMRTLCYPSVYKSVLCPHVQMMSMALARLHRSLKNLNQIYLVEAGSHGYLYLLQSVLFPPELKMSLALARLRY